MRVFIGLAAFAAGISLALPLAAEPKTLPATAREAVASSEATLSPGATSTSELTPTAASTATDSAAIEAARPKPQPPAIVARINLSTQRIDVAVNGQAVHNWAISSGRSGFATPRGTFRVQWTSKMWYSRKYDNAPMPHAVFFNGGVAVHATQAIGMLGRPASHGCIRLAPGNAATFFNLVQKHGNHATRIEVFGTPSDRGSERIAERRERSNGRTEVRRVSQPRELASARTSSQDSSGRLYLRPSHVSYGQASFVQDGIRYVRVR